ncbi:MAG: hypothetical protein NC417_09625 [Candidatus Gastranaerophilales bacterium]|nr:hypothetical protein [Candidatus Gastranaerophilales bacterium]
MNGLFEKAMLGGVFFLLFVGFLALLYRIRWLEQLSQALKRTRDSMDETTRKRLLENRKNLQDIHRKYSLWMWLEQELAYSGLRVRFPFLNVERFLVLSILFAAAVFLIVLLFGGLLRACIGVFFCVAAEYIVLQTGKFRTMSRVNENLIKFLDFLGSYSITAGEITGIFHQISRYVEEPLQSALEECYYEAQTTGDTNLALLSMAEKIEHPKFKELARNMEISIRYCADFTALVNNSRRSIREYHRMGDEKKGMLREAAINMLLLAAMSVLVLLTVDGLIGVSMWNVLRDTIPGRIAAGVLGVIAFLFLRQIYRIHR